MRAALLEVAAAPRKAGLACAHQCPGANFAGRRPTSLPRPLTMPCLEHKLHAVASPATNTHHNPAALPALQWNLTQPLLSLWQHQSFLESDQPCIQLEKPAPQS